MEFRPARPEDSSGIRKVHLEAFPTPVEADLVERLLSDGDAVISIIADDDGIVGHVMLSRMTVEADGRPLHALGLAPVAVVPEHQGQGIGPALVAAAVCEARSIGAQFLFVVGEPGYYGRFGFDAATAKPFVSPYAGPYFQALALTELSPVSAGIAQYAPAFSDLE